MQTDELVGNSPYQTATVVFRISCLQDTFMNVICIIAIRHCCLNPNKTLCTVHYPIFKCKGLTPLQLSIQTPCQDIVKKQWIPGLHISRLCSKILSAFFCRSDAFIIYFAYLLKMNRKGKNMYRVYLRKALNSSNAPVSCLKLSASYLK